MTDLDRARDFFAADKFATKTTGIIIEEVGENYAKCSLQITEAHKNAAGAVMGGAIFTLADFTFAVASNFDKPHCVSTTSQITYLSPAKGARLISTAKMIRDGRSTCFYEIDIDDDIGTKVAFVTMSGMKVGK